MITKGDVIHYFKNNNDNKVNLCLSPDEENLYNRDTGKYFCSVDEFLNASRKVAHCDFEVIYEEHATLDVVYRCKECGTVIFSGDDIERYDPNLICPTCSGDDSHCGTDYWNKEMIDSDVDKRNCINWMLEETARKEEMYKRMKSRGGLYDWQRWVKKFVIGRYMFQISHICFGWGIKNAKKDRYIEVEAYIKDKDSIGLFSRIGSFKIPLSLYNIKCRYLYYKKYKNKEQKIDESFS